MTVILALVVTIAIVLAPAAGFAQSRAATHRIGVLSPFMASGDSFLEAVQEGLGELGYLPGRNLVLEYRSANGRADRLAELAAELVRLRVDVIVTASSPGVRAAKQATSTIPIVVGAADDPVEQGFVASLARPGGNITGISWLNPELSAKRLGLLKEALPNVARIAVLREALGGASSLRATTTAARALGVQLQLLELRDPTELEAAFAAMVRERAGAVSVLHSAMITSELKRVVELASTSRLPAIYPDARFVEAGGLMSYGPRLPQLFRRAAIYVDKILRGARVGDLPIEQPTTFELVINLNTVRASGLTLPTTLLGRADRVIE